MVHCLNHSKEAAMSRLAALAFLACVAAQPSFGADDKVVGTWKLVSNNYEVQSNGQTAPTMGENPTGYIHFTPEGRVFVVFSANGRQPAKTDQERAALLGSLTAYTGKYRVDGNTWTTDVEVAWAPEWVGTAQKREFKIDGDRLQVMTPWRMMPNLADKGMTRGVLTFERVK
jgi:Lipocalin-like domain